MEKIKDEEMIDYIEGIVGCYHAIWHEWPTKDIEELYFYIRIKERMEEGLPLAE